MAQNLLNVRELSMTYGVEPLFDGVGFGVQDGERVAIVGPNGCGKSTLFRILAGEVLPHSGVVARRTDTTIGYLPQEADFDPGTTPRKVVSGAMARVRDAIEEYELVSAALEDAATGEVKQLLARQGELHDTIRTFGGWDWRHRVEEMLDRLGISHLIDTPLGSLSGGQQRRVDLARVLLEAPDLLLLDEPTNHLDADAVEWLEGWLKTHAGTLLLVTHDRYFLERVVERILEIDEEGFFDYPGNYETFMERKLQRMAIRKRTEERRQHLLAKELDWLRGGVKARTTRSEKRLKQLEGLEEEGPAYEDEQMQMELAEAARLGDVILAARGLHKSYGAEKLLESANIALRPGDKLGMVGPNGCGKTTLLRILLGEERPDAGDVEKGKRTTIAYMRQEELPVDPRATVYEAMGESDYVWVGDHRYHKRDYLDRFLFDRDLQKAQVRVLSGGQRRRLALARLVAQNANVLILDEPTNDLDIMSLQALESALENFTGCILAVSHDRYFLNRVCTSIVAFEERKIVRYVGDYDNYRRRRQVVQEAEREADAPARSEPVRESKSPSAKPRKLTYAERLKLEELEAQIAACEDRKSEIENSLADPALYAERPDEIEPLNRALTEVNQQMERLMKRWMSLEERR